MKNIIIFAFTLLAMAPAKIDAQEINWANLPKDHRNLLNINAGFEYGLTFGARYGYQLKTKIPAILVADFSIPSGNNLTDDFKTKIGGYFRVLEVNNFQVSAKVMGVFRRYENLSARLLNFGSDMGVAAGYYQPKWFVSAETGFDKAIVTHFKHSELSKQNFPSIKDGWYEPATGGNFYYGLQTGFSLKRNDIYLKLGKVLTQDFSTSPLAPYYLQVGYNIWL